jgi:hypothetical protein
MARGSPLASTERPEKLEHFLGQDEQGNNVLLSKRRDELHDGAGRKALIQ